MKFLHVSDMHLGFQTYREEVNYDYFSSASYVFSYAKDKGIKLVVISGDVFDRRDPSSQIQKGFASILSRAVRDGIEVFIVTGNHEGAPFFERSIHLDVYRELEIPGVEISKIPEVCKTNGLNIVSIPYPFKRNLLVKEEYRDKSEIEVLQILNDKLLHILDDLLGKIDKTFPTILAAHLPLTEGKMNEGIYSRFDTDMPISVEELDRESFSYAAMGHYHKMQILMSRKFNHPFVYAGSLDRITFSEELDDKGFFVVEVDEKTHKASFEFKQNPFTRSFYTVEVKTDQDVLSADLEKAAKSITRVVLINDLSDERLLQDLTKKLKEVSLAFAGVVDKREMKSTSLTSTFKLAISPQEAIVKYLNIRDDEYVKSNKQKITETALKIISEVQND